MCKKHLQELDYSLYRTNIIIFKIIFIFFKFINNFILSSFVMSANFSFQENMESFVGEKLDKEYWLKI